IISASDYFFFFFDDYNIQPYNTVQLKADGDTTVFQYSGTTQQANSVDGIWGCHDDYSEAFQSVDTVQDNPLAVGDTELTVADANGEDENGMTPRFQDGQLIRFGTGGTAELGAVVRSKYDTNILTIKRGVNGSTAAEQANGTAIYVYRPMYDVVNTALILSAWAYRRKDSVGAPDDRPIATSTGVVILPSKLPGEVLDAIRAHRTVDR
ncbi:MAG: hypothetical protein GY869_03780, partial [Planctomycetes bacterium]|nr:hypothetical protein [Planctomycetota bacterium]